MSVGCEGKINNMSIRRKVRTAKVRNIRDKEKSYTQKDY